MDERMNNYQQLVLYFYQLDVEGGAMFTLLYKLINQNISLSSLTEKRNS